MLDTAKKNFFEEEGCLEGKENKQAYKRSNKQRTKVLKKTLKPNRSNHRIKKEGKF